MNLSLREPLIPINIESDSAGGAKKIADKIYGFMNGCDELDITPLKDFIESLAKLI